MKRLAVTPAQLRMLRRLARYCASDAKRFGTECGWIEIADLIRDDAHIDSNLGWRNADRIFGALERRALVEREPTCDELIRPSTLGQEILAQAEQEQRP